MASGRDTGHGLPGRGRHRHRADGTTRTPPAERAAIEEPSPEEDTDVLPVVSVRYLDGTATGLAKFDLGSIPASVTPPRSWRHAAWFAVAASILVLVGLAYAAVTLVTGPRKPEVIDALPSLPSQEFLTDFPGDVAPTERPTTSPSSTSSPSATRGPTRSPSPRPTVSATGDGPAAPSAPPSAPVARPTRSTVTSPMLVPPPNNPMTMGDRTEAYYAQVVDNPDAAYALTTGPLRREGADSIERRYADVARVAVERIVIDPNRSKTRSVLRVTRKDGTVTTEERELTFTFGADPKISSDAVTA
ncbi:hypothetical protein [Actinokineospora sp.]|uniref:hypothetical protein n=1 Tax=Actinokineospora sp. TaxID=1872133 RepID=UPI004037F84F